jgi:hypothetical protein
MEIQNAPTPLADARTAWTSLLELVPENTVKGQELRKAIGIRMNTSLNTKKYGQKIKLANDLREIKEKMPNRILGLMNTMAVALDDGDTDSLQEMMFDPDNKNSLIECVADLLFISNHTEVIQPKKTKASSQRLTRAQTLARASDPNDGNFGFCPKCNRPMLRSGIALHQKNTTICVEIKSGKKKAVELKKVKDRTMGAYIAQQVFVDENDSEDEDIFS